MPDPLPFQVITEDDYAQTFVDACTPTQIRRGVLLTGPCPRCQDPMEYELSTGIFLGGAPGGPGDVLPVMCTCSATHPGRPGGDEGCGAYWTVTKAGTEA
jgi:hypothetical protein